MRVLVMVRVRYILEPGIVFHTPVVLATGKAEASRFLEPRSSGQPGLN
jgi:hypothetical protein